MKELSIEEKARRYDEAIEIAKEINNEQRAQPFNVMTRVFPEIKEFEDERIRKELLEHCKNQAKPYIQTGNKCPQIQSWIAWLEKQGDTNETIDRDKFAQGVLRGAAINLITWIDYNAAEGNMCLSNMECKDIEDALVGGDWNKIYTYIKKKLEKQDEKKPYGQRQECVDCQFNYAGECKGSCGIKR